MRLSVIVPTIGRQSLTRTIASITAGLRAGDEILVLYDNSGDWGHTARNRGMAMATGDYLMFMDDDDIYVPGAFNIVRTALAANPGRPHIFGMKRHGLNDILPKKHEAVYGNVSTQMFVTPNDKERLGRWTHQYAGDCDFIQSTLALWPAADSLVWCDDVIAEWRVP